MQPRETQTIHVKNATNQSNVHLGAHPCPQDVQTQLIIIISTKGALSQEISHPILPIHDNNIFSETVEEEQNFKVI